MDWKTSQIGAVSLLGKIQLILGLTTLLVRIPLHLASRAIFHGRFRGAIKASGIQLVRTVLQYSMPQIQWLSTPTNGVYNLWTRLAGTPEFDTPAPEILVDGARLYWIGPKRTDKVVLYVPGGAFMIPVQLNSLHFWNYVRSKLEAEGVHAGFALVEYSLYPDVHFPGQLRQLCAAIDHVLASGVRPRDLHLVGDSAGANLILQLFSHILHPLHPVQRRTIGPVLLPPLRLNAPLSYDHRLGSAYLMSPLVTMESSTESFTNPHTKDIFVGPNVLYWSRQYAFDVPLDQMPYITPLAAAQHPTWFAGLSRVVKGVLISAGEEERFKDDIVAFAEGLTQHTEKGPVEVRFELQEGGVHDDPFYDFMLGGDPKDVGSLTPLIVGWLKEKIGS